MNMISSRATLKDTLPTKKYWYLALNTPNTRVRSKSLIYLLKRSKSTKPTFHMGIPPPTGSSPSPGYCLHNFIFSCMWVETSSLCFDGVLFLAGISRRGKNTTRFLKRGENTKPTFHMGIPPPPGVPPPPGTICPTSSSVVFDSVLFVAGFSRKGNITCWCLQVIGCLFRFLKLLLGLSFVSG